MNKYVKPYQQQGKQRAEPVFGYARRQFKPKSNGHLGKRFRTEAVAEPASQEDERWIWQNSKDALHAYGLLATILLVGSIPQLSQISWASFPYFVLLASTTIYIGSHRGLTSQQREVISLKQGVLAPVAASVVLFGGYLVIKFFPNLTIQTFIDAYFWFIGSFAIAGAAQACLQQVGGPLAERSILFDLPSWLVDLEKSQEVTQIRSSIMDILSLVIGLGVASLELFSHHGNFTLSNLVACLVVTDIMGLIGLKSFRVAAVLLFGLLFYDVFWVFASPSVVGDNVMLTVATSNKLQGPTRLMFPRGVGMSASEAKDFPFSILGLGDVAIPGFLGCLALRFDESRSTDMAGRAKISVEAMSATLEGLPVETSSKEAAIRAADAAEAAFDKFADKELKQREGEGGESNGQVPVSESVMQQRNYFLAVLVAYNLGLAAAFVANSVTGLGQPALLYLVPCTLSAIVILGFLRKEIVRVWQFTDKASLGEP